MAAASLVISILALLVAGAAVFYARQQSASGIAQATAATRQTVLLSEQHHREETPVLVITRASPRGSTVAIYSVRNDSPLDLTSVLVRRPEVNSGLIFPVSTADTDPRPPNGDFENIGPIPAGEDRRFHLTVGGTPTPIPELRVIVECSATGDRSWRLAPILLDSPWRRPPPVVRGPS